MRVCGVDQGGLQLERRHREGSTHAATGFVHQLDVVGPVFDVLTDVWLCVGGILEFGPGRHCGESLAEVSEQEVSEWNMERGSSLPRAIYHAP